MFTCLTTSNLRGLCWSRTRSGEYTFLRPPRHGSFDLTAGLTAVEDLEQRIEKINKQTTAACGWADLANRLARTPFVYGTIERREMVFYNNLVFRVRLKKKKKVPFHNYRHTLCFSYPERYGRVARWLDIRYRRIGTAIDTVHTVGTVRRQISNYNFKSTDSCLRYANADYYDCRGGEPSPSSSFLIFVFIRCSTVTRLSFIAIEGRSIFE